MRNPDQNNVFLMGGSRESGTLYVMKSYPRDRLFMKQITGKPAELIAASADAELYSYNYLSDNTVECDVHDNKNNRYLGRTRRIIDSDEEIAKQVAQMMDRQHVTITIR